MEELSPIEKIFSDDNNENVVLYNADDKAVEFEQIAIVPLHGKDYCILKPVIPFENMQEDEAIVFVLNDEDEEPSLDVELDDKIVDEVFDIYYGMVEDAIASDKE